MKSIDSVYIKDIRYENADSLLKAINYGGELYNALSTDFIYRGHYSEEYLLLPYALREGSMDMFYPGLDYEDDKALYVTRLLISQIWGEYQLLQRFYDLCDKNNLRVPDSVRLRDSVVKKYDLVSLYGEEDWLPRDLWEIAALAQHYGIPTRLLDWTASIKTAMYFAIADFIKPIPAQKRIEQQKQYLLNDGKIIEEYCEIWALDTKVIVAQENKLPLKLIRPPYHDNPNLAAQEGVFTLWPVSKPVYHMKSKVELDMQLVDRTPLDVLLVNKLVDLKADERPYLYRILFPQRAAIDLFAFLERTGHTAAKLFPGFGGVAQSIREMDRFQDKRIRKPRE